MNKKKTRLPAQDGKTVNVPGKIIERIEKYISGQKTREGLTGYISVHQAAKALIEKALDQDGY